jgi:hypothetical protein
MPSTYYQEYITLKQRSVQCHALVAQEYRINMGVRGGFRGVSEVSGNPLLVISILHLTQLSSRSHF